MNKGIFFDFFSLRYSISQSSTPLRCEWDSDLLYNTGNDTLSIALDGNPIYVSEERTIEGNKANMPKYSVIIQKYNIQE